MSLTNPAAIVYSIEMPYEGALVESAAGAQCVRPHMASHSAEVCRPRYGLASHHCQKVSKHSDATCRIAGEDGGHEHLRWHH